MLQMQGCILGDVLTPVRDQPTLNFCMDAVKSSQGSGSRVGTMGGLAALGDELYWDGFQDQVEL